MDPSKSTGAKPIDIQIHGCQAPVAPVLTPPLEYVFCITIIESNKKLHIPSNINAFTGLKISSAEALHRLKYHVNHYFN